MTYDLVIPLLPPSLNKLLRMHWSDRKRLSRDAHLAVYQGWHSAGRPTHQDRYAIVTYQLHHHGVERDTDNGIGSLKPITDQLVRWGVIKDDSPKHATILLQSKQTAAPKQGFVTARIQYAMTDAGDS